ncbi:uncharacterized protein LOC6596215 [Drosophila persimilis]|uniref:uncharacterized protein LOC6596215 n=1 Tax=Drosophila persimilis TaxID=7234 RepID=UPI000F080485|nr:uncharacterized protein LOC6596215 [Drosophila persimilis]
MWLKALILIPMILAQHAAATCGVCQPVSRTVCLSENTFSACVKGVPLNDIIKCPTNFFCTDGDYTCYENADPVCKADSAPETTTVKPWTAEEACQQTTKSGFLENENDPTCTSYLYCKFATDGSLEILNLNCPTNKYFDASIKGCTDTKPAECTEVSTTLPTDEIPATIATTTTTTEKPWSAEETCLNVTKSTSFTNEDDPTCATYLFCYVANGAVKALIKSCPSTTPYFDSTISGCSATKPNNCT